MEVAIHTERLHDDRVWRRVRSFALFLNRISVFGIWFSVNPTARAYRALNFDEKKWIDRLAWLARHGQTIEQHTHFYANEKGVYNLSAAHVRAMIEEDKAWLVRHGYLPSRFISGGWQMNIAIKNILREKGYTDETECVDALSPRRAILRILSGKAGLKPPFLYIHDYELLNPLISLATRAAILFWARRSISILRHPHDHKRLCDWRRIFSFIGAFNSTHPFTNILELGAGTGNISSYFAARGISATAHDICPEYLSIAGGRDHRIRTVLHDANEKLPFADNSFDAVFCIGTLHYAGISSVEAVLLEMRRVSRAYVVIDLFSKYSLYAFFECIFFPRFVPRRYSAREAGALFSVVGLRPIEAISTRSLPGFSRWPFMGKSGIFILEKDHA